MSRNYNRSSPDLGLSDVSMGSAPTTSLPDPKTPNLFSVCPIKPYFAPKGYVECLKARYILGVIDINIPMIECGVGRGSTL